MRTRIAVFIFALAAARSAGARADGPRIVLLPLGNLSGVERAPSDLAEPLAARLAAKGWDVERGEKVESFLARNRVRFVDSLTADARGRVLSEFGAEAVMTGNVLAWAEGPNSHVALGARIVRANGSVAWTGAVGLTAEETEGLLGIGRAVSMPALAGKALDRLFATLPAAGRESRAHTLGTPLFKAAPATYRSVALAGAGVRRVCLLPFENFTSVRDAPRVLEDLLGHELLSSGRFEVVEAAELRAALVAERLRGLGSLEPAELAALGKRLGTRLFLRGTVYRYVDVGARTNTAMPEMDVQLALVDAVPGRVVWTASNARSGRDYKGLLQLGALRSVVALSDQAFGEIVSAEGKATPKGAPTP